MRPGHYLVLLPLLFTGCDEKKQMPGDHLDTSRARTASTREATAANRSKDRAPRDESETEDPASPNPAQLKKIAATVQRFLEGEGSVAALEWAKTLENPAEKQAALEQIAWNSDPHQVAITALMVHKELAPGPERTKISEHLAAQFATADSVTALAWAKNLSDPDDRDAAINGWATATAEANPGEAARTAVEEIRPGAVHNRAVVAILQRWVQTDPEGARDWLSDFPEGPLKTDALLALQGK